MIGTRRTVLVLTSIQACTRSVGSAGTVRYLSRSGASRDASQPAPSSASTSQNPHAARVAAASNSSTNTGGDARSRLAKLQAQRLEELNRGRAGGSGGSRPNRPQQKWSNRTLIALATSVGACTYLMGTYHGYNLGKQHAQEQQELGLAPVEGAVAPTAIPSVGAKVASAPATAQGLTSFTQSLVQLLPFSSLSNPIHCESEPKVDRKCRLAELTQYHCDLYPNRVVCQPIDRIFRM